jgi:hypothetical protein
MKLNTKPLKFKCGLANRGGGPGWQTRARHGYPHLVIYKNVKLVLGWKWKMLNVVNDNVIIWLMGSNWSALTKSQLTHFIW